MGRVLFMIKYYYNSRKYVTLTFDIWHDDLDLFSWPWPWCLTLRLIYYYIDALKKTLQINVWRHVTQKRYFVRYIGDNIPDRYFFKEHDAPN